MSIWSITIPGSRRQMRSVCLPASNFHVPRAVSCHSFWAFEPTWIASLSSMETYIELLLPAVERTRAVAEREPLRFISKA